MLNMDELFHPEWGGAFLARHGKARSGSAMSQKKLYFTATDREFLAQFLLDLTERDDCVSVKFAVEPRDGMYLGRCYVTTDDVAGKWWSVYKAHDRMMCNLQDDAFTIRFRDFGSHLDHDYAEQDSVG